VEASIDRQEVPVDDREIRQTTLGDLMRRYRDEVRWRSPCCFGPQNGRRRERHDSDRDAINRAA